MTEQLLRILPPLETSKPVDHYPMQTGQPVWTQPSTQLTDLVTDMPFMAASASPTGIPVAEIPQAELDALFLITPDQLINAINEQFDLDAAFAIAPATTTEYQLPDTVDAAKYLP